MLYAMFVMLENKILGIWGSVCRLLHLLVRSLFERMQHNVGMVLVEGQNVGMALVEGQNTGMVLGCILL